MKRLVIIVGCLLGITACDPAADTSAPEFKLGPDLSVRDTSVSIAFVTDEPANALVEYGPTTAYGTAVLDDRFIIDHVVLVRNLEPQTTYNLRLLTYDPLDNGPTTSKNFEITTLALLPPPLIIVNEVLANASVESSGEFIELFNAGPDTVTLSGWEIADNSGSDKLVPFTALGGDTLDLDPGQFALILDPDYGAGGEDYGFADPPAVVLLTVEDTALGGGSGLANATDTVTLRASDGKVVSTYGSPENLGDAIPFDPGDGVSAERCVVGNADVDGNWHASDAGPGHTAGAPNTSATCP